MPPKRRLMNVRWFFFLIFIGVTFKSTAQSPSKYKLPIYFGLFFKDPFFNSVNLLQDQRGSASLGHRRNSGEHGSVNTSFAAVQIRLGEEGKESFNETGLHFFSDNEGKFLSTTRAYINYARHLKLNNNYNLAGGLSFGFYNYAIKSDGTIEAVSEMTMDGDALLKLYNEFTSYQIVINQIYNSSIQPINEERVLVRNINFFWNRSFKIWDEFTSRNHFITRWSQKTTSPLSGLNFALNSQLIFQKSALVGLTVYPTTGTYFSIGIEEIPSIKYKLGFELAYLVPFPNNSVTRVEQFELILDFKF